MGITEQNRERDQNPAWFAGVVSEERLLVKHKDVRDSRRRHGGLDVNPSGYGHSGAVGNFQR